MFFVVLLILSPLLSVSGGINLTYIVKKDKNKLQPSCIAEEFERYDAVGWVYPLPGSQQGIPNVTTKYIPTINNDYNCKFSKNDICNTRWILRDWSINDASFRSHDFIADQRWEDLPTIFISNTTKEFEEKVELHSVFTSGISIRASGTVELFICSGWNPKNYPCYYFHIYEKEIYFGKYAELPKDLETQYNKTYLEYYKAFSNIISHDEWRNFVVSIDDARTIKLIDVNLNRTVIQHVDKEPLNAMYLFMRSSNASLWKIHENHFLFTNTTQISRLGPQLTIFNTDLCVSLFVTTCDNCEMTFFYQNGTIRKDLKYIGPQQNNQWREIKIKQENIQFDRLNLFVQTKFKNPSLNTSGLWAIDDVRVCNENEVKVSYLKLNGNLTEKEASALESSVSCQLIRKPSWRPKKFAYNEIKDFPVVHTFSNSTSIKLTWEQEDPLKLINYFISYQAEDICSDEPYNMRRIKSNGFLMSKYSDIVINNLVPFTLYNVTISTVLHEKDQLLHESTLPTEKPTPEELPIKVKVRPTSTSVIVSWEKVDCRYKYGTLIYNILVTNVKLNFTKKLSLQTGNNYTIDSLEPYTNYTLKIFTARNARSFENENYDFMEFTFTTLPGVAPTVENLELYSIDTNSASLRYDLPKDAKGIPREIQVNKCNMHSFNKCKPFKSQIRRCTFWPKKYCITLIHLIEHQFYSFKVSLQNVNTYTFGEEVTVEGWTIDKIPGKPENVTYKIVDCDISTEYCHLNITWTHPYHENGTITSFNIILNSTVKNTHSEDAKYIHEVYKVVNKTYFAEYAYQVKYIPYSTHYNLYLQSANAAGKSDYAKTEVKTDDIGQHIDQSPKLLGTSSSSLIFKVPYLDRRLKFYTLTVLVQDFDRKKRIDPKLMDNRKVAENLCHSYGETWISQVVKVENNSTENIMIGNSEKEKIKPNTEYCITFIITNKYKESEHDVVYYKKLITPEAPPPIKAASSSSPYKHLYILLLLLLLVPVGFLIYRYLRKKRIVSEPSQNNENVYESLPFEDCENNFVNNDNYDHLLHK